MKRFKLLIFLAILLNFTACQGSHNEWGETEAENLIKDKPPEKNESIDRPACTNSQITQSKQIDLGLRCRKATDTQLKMVNEGNAKKEEFLSRCYTATENSCWCDQLVRPNPQSIETFFCTYGESQVHQLIHPDEKTWEYAFEAVKIVEELEDMQINTQIIYNWWRPEPYNKNVGGAALRHPYGTSVDVRFETKAMQELAFLELCKMRAQGRLRAIGYYATTALHFGIGDSRANTWGKACP